MSLTPLDTSVTRFLEFSLTLIFPDVEAEKELRDASRSLLEQWPILASRLNLLRTDLSASKSEQQPDVFSGRKLNKKLSDIVNVSSITTDCASPSSSDKVKQLDGLFNFGNSLKTALRGQVFNIRAVFFLDTTIIRFTFQHPLCDASGAAYAISRRYCDILNSTKIEDISLTRFPLMLKDGIDATAAGKEKDAPKPPAAAETSRDIFRGSWRYMIRKGTKMLLRDLRRPSCKRVDDTFHIPAAQMEAWKEDALKQDNNVTEHDLLTAFIYQSCYQVSPPCAQDFSMILRIRPYLENQTPLQNAWVVLPVAIEHLYESQKSEHASLPKIAAEIHRSIREARRPENLSPLLDFQAHGTTKPMIPRWIGRDQPQVTVTSWTGLGLYDLDIHGSRPVFVHGELDLWGLLKGFGLGMDDIVITWKGPEPEGGYWIRGRLNASAWEKMARTLAQN
ncbi:hypothetical protein BDW74DRAFT_176668 [Aspergillus multicolor]|uniref:uncharacterized protein n=1 Tax=Aspergillus multicolor TaxID=41759 RepID=UPI003CCDEA6A